MKRALRLLGLVALAAGSAWAGASVRDRVSPEELARALAERPGQFVVVDVRSALEFRASEGHIGGATSLPYPNILWRADEVRVQPGQIVVLICRSGHRSRYAMKAVRESTGAEVFDLEGGMLAWWAAGLPVVLED